MAKVQCGFSVLVPGFYKGQSSFYMPVLCLSWVLEKSNTVYRACILSWCFFQFMKIYMFRVCVYLWRRLRWICCLYVVLGCQTGLSLRFQKAMKWKMVTRNLLEVLLVDAAFAIILLSFLYFYWLFVMWILYRLYVCIFSSKTKRISEVLTKCVVK